MSHSKRCVSGKQGSSLGESAVRPSFIPELTSTQPKSNAERLAEYRIKYMALTCKEAA